MSNSAEIRSVVVPPSKTRYILWKEFLDTLKSPAGGGKNDLQMAVDSFNKSIGIPSQGNILGTQPTPPTSDPDSETKIFRIASEIIRGFATQQNARKFKISCNLYQNPKISNYNQAPTAQQQKNASKYPLDFSGAQDHLTEIIQQVSTPDLFIINSERDKIRRSPATNNTYDIQATCDLLDIVMLGLAPCLFEIKAAAAVGRPESFTGQKPPKKVITPQHSSWPSGHAFFSYITARVLLKIGIPDTVLSMGAKRISDNRVSAGLHTDLDSGAGKTIANQAMDLLFGLLTSNDSELTDRGQFIKEELSDILGQAQAEWAWK